MFNKLEEFYINKILPHDKRSLMEIIKEEFESSKCINQQSVKPEFIDENGWYLDEDNREHHQCEMLICSKCGETTKECSKSIREFGELIV